MSDKSSGIFRSPFGAINFISKVTVPLTEDLIYKFAAGKSAFQGVFDKYVADFNYMYEVVATIGEYANANFDDLRKRMHQAKLAIATVRGSFFTLKCTILHYCYSFMFSCANRGYLTVYCDWAHVTCLKVWDLTTLEF